jgi:hypothetical protein
MAHKGKRNLQVSIIGAKHARVIVGIERPHIVGRLAEYTPNHWQLDRIENMIQDAIEANELDVHITLLPNSIWIDVYGL